MSDLQEEIDLAFRAGINCALENVELMADVYPDDYQLDLYDGFSVDKAVTDYVNKRESKSLAGVDFEG